MERDDRPCEECGKPCFVAVVTRERACSDPECINARGAEMCGYCGGSVFRRAAVVVSGALWHNRCRTMWEHDERMAAMMQRVSNSQR